MGLRVFNVLGRTKQDFTPITPGFVNMYVCGPTVYDHAHLGHAKNYVNFDIIVRYLRYSGLNVLYVQNITDVGHMLDSGEDRILKKARQSQSLPMQIVETYAKSYFDDMDALGVRRADISPRASAHIPEQIKMVEALIAKGHAYVVNGSVYFDVTSAPNYGKLSNRRLENTESGNREIVRDDKRNPEDFALWKNAEPEHILRWESPWGEGFPGWHIECSAMAKKYLGTTFDIHGGGIDNLFPHNESELVQSECANDAAFANYWLLGGSLTVDGEKMSKSLGNFTTIKDALRDHRPQAIRMFAMSAHYTNPVDYSEDAMQAAGAGWERIYGAVRLTRQMLPSAPAGDDGNAFLARLDSAKADFVTAMDDDFNMPKAVAVLQELTRDVNSLLNSRQSLGKNTLDAINKTYNTIGGDVLGIIPTTDLSSGNNKREGGLIQLLIDLRAQAKQNKNYAESDRIRTELLKLGVVLEDRPDGTVWRTS